MGAISEKTQTEIRQLALNVLCPAPASFKTGDVVALTKSVPRAATAQRVNGDGVGRLLLPRRVDVLSGHAAGDAQVAVGRGPV